MYCKLITENDCAVNAVLSCTPVELLIINKAIARCSNDEFYTESDRRTMVLMGEAMKNFEQVEVADTPQTDLPTEEFVEGMKNLRMEVKQTDCSWK